VRENDRGHVAEAPVEPAEHDLELRPVLRRTCVGDGESAAVLDDVPVHELRAEAPDAARDLGWLGRPHRHRRILAENGRSPPRGRASPSAPAASRYLSSSAACFGVTTRVITFSQFTNTSCSDAFS